MWNTNNSTTQQHNIEDKRVIFLYLAQFIHINLFDTSAFVIMCDSFISRSNSFVKYCDAIAIVKYCEIKCEISICVAIFNTIQCIVRTEQ